MASNEKFSNGIERFSTSLEQASNMDLCSLQQQIQSTNEEASASSALLRHPG
jgi:hypothetical protein